MRKARQWRAFLLAYALTHQRLVSLRYAARPARAADSA
jgi:hypothetical protein